MSSETKLYLPPSARIGDVADALAITLSANWRLLPIGQGSMALKVDGVKTSTSPTPSMAMIYIDNIDFGQDVGGEYYFHYEGFSPNEGEFYTPGSRLITGYSNAHTAAAFTNLCELFGGHLYYNYGWNDSPDLVVPAPFEWAPEGGEDWQKWQYALSQIPLVTPEQLKGPWQTELGYPR